MSTFFLELRKLQTKNRIWSKKLIARAAMKNYVNILLGVEDAPAQVAVATEETTSKIAGVQDSKG
jgi:hypothetical protein